MTTYNGGRYLAEQIDSILRQTVADFELIIADDGSTDETVAQLHAYAARDERIRVIVNPMNLGLHRNLEQILRRASGHFIAISDQDDIWEDDKLECLLAHIGSNSAAYSDSLLIDSDGKSLGTTLLERIQVAAPIVGDHSVALLLKNCVSGHAVLFRRELLEIVLPFDDRSMFDVQIGFLAAIDRGLVYVERTLVHHRIHGANQTNGGLIPHCDEKTTIKKERHGAKLERYRKRRQELIERLQYSTLCHARLADKGGRWNHARDLTAEIISLTERLKRYDDIWFDPHLFLLLLKMRKKIFYTDEPRVLRRCIKYSKGARYYAWRQ